MKRMLRPLILAMVVASLALASVGTALASSPNPPTNGGNGAGMSGQCTGDAHERPNSCQSPNGHGE